MNAVFMALIISSRHLIQQLLDGIKCLLCSVKSSFSFRMIYYVHRAIHNVCRASALHSYTPNAMLPIDIIIINVNFLRF